MQIPAEHRRRVWVQSRPVILLVELVPILSLAVRTRRNLKIGLVVKTFQEKTDVFVGREPWDVLCVRRRASIPITGIVGTILIIVMGQTVMVVSRAIAIPETTIGEIVIRL
jgi:hypothetical protein